MSANAVPNIGARSGGINDAQSPDPRAPTWAELLQARSADAARTWLKTEIMLAFHRGRLCAETVDEAVAHFGLRSA